MNGASAAVAGIARAAGVGKASHQAGDLVGESPVTRNLESRIRLVARTDATTLIQGESGTGKELVARAIHQQSLRASHRLITVTCAAIPAELFESEFFGHVAGVFSGAIQDRAGRIQLAEQGTLFLDEIGEIPFPMQAKLLRALEQGTYERVGEGRTRKGDIRFIAATNRDPGPGSPGGGCRGGTPPCPPEARLVGHR